LRFIPTDPPVFPARPSGLSLTVEDDHEPEPTGVPGYPPPMPGTSRQVTGGSLDTWMLKSKRDARGPGDDQNKGLDLTSYFDNDFNLFKKSLFKKIILNVQKK
jgi:hypothetical protein